MLDVLTDWVRTVVLLLLFVALVQLLLPEHPMRDYVRMVLGLVVIAAVIGPLFGIFDGESWRFRPVEALPARAPERGEGWAVDTEARTFITRGQTLARKARERIEAGAREEFHRRVRSVVRLMSGVEAATVEGGWDDHGRLAQLTVYIVAAPDASGGLAERVRQAVSDVFDVPPSSVRVRVER